MGSDDILEGLYKLRIRASEKLKTVLALYNLEIHQKKAGPDYHRLKTMVKRSIEQNLRMKNFWGQKRKLWEKRPWSRIRGQNIVNKDFLEIVGNGKPTGSVLKETIAVSVTISISVQNWHSRILLRVLSCGRMREMRREPEVPEARVPVVECLDGLARITSKELAPIHSVKSGILQNARSTSPRMGADVGKSARMHIDRLMNNLVKGPKRMMTKVQWPCWRSMTCMIEWCNPLSAVTPVTSQITDLLGAVHRIHDNWGASFRTWSRRSCRQSYGRAQTCRNQSQRVKFTKAVARHTKIRDKNPFARIDLPRWTSSAPPQRSKIWGSVSGGDRVARARCPRSSVEAGQKVC